MQPLAHLFRLAASCGTSNGALPGLYDNITCTQDPGGGTSVNITSVQDMLKIVSNVVRILIAVSGALAVIVVIVAAIYYITSMGDPGRVKRAKDILVNTVVGLMVIIMAYAVVTFIAKGF